MSAGRRVARSVARGARTGYFTTRDPSQAVQWRAPNPACPAQQSIGLLFRRHRAAAAQGIRRESGEPRADAFKQMAKTFGVTVKDIFWTQGRYDIVTIVEAPDVSAAMSLNLSLGALGNVRTDRCELSRQRTWRRLSAR